MKLLYVTLIILLWGCGSTSDFKEFCDGETKDTELFTICIYLDTINSTSDSIGYQSGNGEPMIIRSRNGSPGGYQFSSPPLLSETMSTRKIRFILRIRSENCVLVNFRNYDSPGIDRYLVYHSVPLDSCKYFEDKVPISDPNSDALGYYPLDSNWTISIESLPDPFDN